MKIDRLLLNMIKRSCFPLILFFDCQGLETYNADACHFHYVLLLCLRCSRQFNKTRNINKKHQFEEKIVFPDKELDYFLLRISPFMWSSMVLKISFLPLCRPWSTLGEAPIRGAETVTLLASKLGSCPAEVSLYLQSLCSYGVLPKYKKMKPRSCCQLAFLCLRAVEIPDHIVT